MLLATASFLANLFIWAMIYFTCKCEQIKFKKFHVITVGAVFTVFFIYSFLYLQNRQFSYYWDFANYMQRQIQLEHEFANSIIGGIKFWIKSMDDDYTFFINIFTEFPYCLTQKTGNAYILCFLFNTLLPILVLLCGLMIKLYESFGVEENKLLVVESLLFIISIPVFRLSAMFGQPDWLGLIFAFIIVILTFHYRFEKRELIRYALILISTGCLIVTRRWYLYFLVGYYFMYLVILLANSFAKIKQHNEMGKKQIINALQFAIGSAVMIVILFLPMISKILRFNYSNRYFAYNAGGFPVEIVMQLIWFTVLWILIIGGCTFLMKEKNHEQFWLVVGGYFLSMFLFTRVQNMGAHHVLLLFPFYCICFILGTSYFLKIFSKRRAIVYLILSAIILVNGTMHLSVFQNMIIPSFLLPRSDSRRPFNDDTMMGHVINDSLEISLLTDNRTDLDEILELNEWIDNNCKEGEYCYFVPHDSIYNPDIIKNVDFPEMKIANKIAFGFDVLGTQKFPVELYDAKYVITMEPFFVSITTQNRLSQRLNDIILSGVGTIYEPVHSFDMGNGFIIRAYQRTKAADRNEIDLYRHEFEAENEQFPDLFEEQWNRYMDQKLLQESN